MGVQERLEELRHSHTNDTYVPKQTIIIIIIGLFTSVDDVEAMGTINKHTKEDHLSKKQLRWLVLRIAFMNLLFLLSQSSSHVGR